MLIYIYHNVVLVFFFTWTIYQYLYMCTCRYYLPVFIHVYMYYIPLFIHMYMYLIFTSIYTCVHVLFTSICTADYIFNMEMLHVNHHGRNNMIYCMCTMCSFALIITNKTWWINNSNIFQNLWQLPISHFVYFRPGWKNYEELMGKSTEEFEVHVFRTKFLNPNILLTWTWKLKWSLVSILSLNVTGTLTVKLFTFSLASLMPPILSNLLKSKWLLIYATMHHC